MGRTSLAPEQRAQVEEMVKAKKPAAEIISFMKTTYNVDIKKSFIYYLNKQQAGEGVASAKTKRGPKSPKKDGQEFAAKPEESLSDEDVIREVLQMIKDSTGLYRMVFLKLRRELIKTVGALYKLKKEFAEYNAVSAELSKDEKA